MNNHVEVYCGSGKGKTTLAMGGALLASVQGKSVMIIQFLKGQERREFDFLEHLDGQDIRIFRFEKLYGSYEDLSGRAREEEDQNILNAMNFARKVIITQECDLLVLDEVLGLLDLGIIKEEDIRNLLKFRKGSMHIVLTGRSFPKDMMDCVDRVTTLDTVETGSA